MHETEKTQEEKGHLVLSRKHGQTIVIDDSIEIEVLQIKPGSVKLLVKAPKDVAISRKEVSLRLGSGPEADQPESDIACA